HREGLLERKAVARIQRQQRAVIDGRSLNFEVERLAEALAQRETQPAVEANSEWSMDDDLRATEAVEKTLDHDALFVGNRAQRCHPATDVIHCLHSRALRQRAFGHQPLRGSLRSLAIDSRRYFVAQIRNFLRQGVGAA